MPPVIKEPSVEMMDNFKEEIKETMGSITDLKSKNSNYGKKIAELQVKMKDTDEMIDALQKSIDNQIIKINSEGNLRRAALSFLTIAKMLTDSYSEGDTIKDNIIAQLEAQLAVLKGIPDSHDQINADKPDDGSQDKKSGRQTSAMSNAAAAQHQTQQMSHKKSWKERWFANELDGHNKEAMAAVRAELVKEGIELNTTACMICTIISTRSGIPITLLATYNDAVEKRNARLAEKKRKLAARKDDDDWFSEVKKKFGPICRRTFSDKFLEGIRELTGLTEEDLDWRTFDAGSSKRPSPHANT